jgi:predicted TIM-barrel fold metal-dependent hydrolase
MPRDLDVLDRTAQQHPGLKLVIDHVGLDRRRGDRVWDDLPAVCALARHPNVAVKASGMPSLSKERYPFRDLHPTSARWSRRSARAGHSGAPT